jgi:putative FmdB family regulatory protein
MPIYEYECRACRHHFELVVLPTTIPACPSCQSQELERTISMFAVSSDGTRRLARSSGKKRAASIKRDKDHAQAEYEKNHCH